jgi:LPS-assembly protein
MRFFLVVLTIFCFAFSVFGQQTNPVERQVSNPLTDTPNVNPISDESAPKPAKNKQKKDSDYVIEGGDGELVVYSIKQSGSGEEGKKVVVHEGRVDIRYGIYRMQADKITVIEATNMMIAVGNVVFDQGEDQRITGTRSEWNYKTKTGYFVDSTGFTNQTNDGTVIYFTADRVERISLDEIKIINGQFTACEDSIPKWSFTAREVYAKTNVALKMKNPKFRIKNIAVLPLPYLSIPLRKDDRKSGLLTPTVGYSTNKGARLSTAYYQTLGRSADITLRGDIYTARGFGYGFDARTRANSRSYFNFGFYAVKDRIFGSNSEFERKPDQGGSIVYANGIQYFPNGFTAALDIRLTSSLAFRQVFSDGIQQVISPIEISKGFINKSWNDFSLNIQAKSEVISIPNVRVKTRNLPSVHFEKRPSPLKFLDNAYFSFKTSIEGVSRREAVDDINLYRQIVGSDPIVTPVIGQRFDLFPQLSVPITTKYATFTVTGGFRATYYSNSLDVFRRVLPRNIIRSYGEFEFDVRPVALAKNFYRKNGSFRFRHTIEPYLTYRLVKGVNDFNRLIRFDYLDTISDTNEAEFGVVNRIFTRRYSEAVTPEAQREQQQNPTGKSNLSIQPYEILTFTVRQKHFFDPLFGGALIPGRRNQLSTIAALTPFTYGGIPRRWSPINVDFTYRPERTIFLNTRTDIGVQGDGLRNISATIGYDTRLFKLFQTFYYTRAVDLAPSLQQFGNAFGKEAGTQRGSQWNPSMFVGDRNKGMFGGISLFFDFQNRRATQGTPLISSLGTIGYAYDCCSLVLQHYTFNVGVRRENRYVFSFRLNGIGAFGTEQFGQGLR